MRVDKSERNRGVCSPADQLLNALAEQHREVQNAMLAFVSPNTLNTVADAIGKNAKDLIDFSDRIARSQAPGSERGDVWRVYLDSDLEAAGRLIKRWRPWPYNRHAQRFLMQAPPFIKARLLARLPQDLVDAAKRSAIVPRPWRDNRSYLKDKNGGVTEVTARELTLSFFVRQLKNMARKLNEAAIIAMLSDVPAQPLNDHDGATPSYETQVLELGSTRNPELSEPVWKVDDLLAASPDDSAADALELSELHSSEAVDALAILDTLERATFLTPRQRELLSQLRLQLDQGRTKFIRSRAARALGIKPSTARAHFRNLIERARKAR